MNILFSSRYIFDLQVEVLLILDEVE